MILTKVSSISTIMASSCVLPAEAFMVGLAKLNSDLADTELKFRATSMNSRQVVANHEWCRLHSDFAEEMRGRPATFVRNPSFSAQAGERRQTELSRRQTPQTVLRPNQPGNANRRQTGLLTGRPGPWRSSPLCV